MWRVITLIFCLTLAFPALAEQKKPAYDEDDIPLEYLQEALGVETNCLEAPFSAAHYDCKCLARAFLDERIAQGPGPTTSALLMRVNKGCPNTPGRAGWIYDRCMDRVLLVPPDWPSDDAFCACYANAYARMYEVVHMAPSPRISVDIMSRARASCDAPPPQSAP